MNKFKGDTFLNGPMSSYISDDYPSVYSQVGELLHSNKNCNPRGGEFGITPVVAPSAAGMYQRCRSAPVNYTHDNEDDEEEFDDESAEFNEDMHGHLESIETSLLLPQEPHRVDEMANHEESVVKKSAFSRKRSRTMSSAGPESTSAHVKQQPVQKCLTIDFVKILIFNVNCFFFFAKIEPKCFACLIQRPISAAYNCMVYTCLMKACGAEAHTRSEVINHLNTAHNAEVYFTIFG
jgi:hypothetical protein